MTIHLGKDILKQLGKYFPQLFSDCRLMHQRPNDAGNHRLSFSGSEVSRLDPLLQKKYIYIYVFGGSLKTSLPKP